MADFNIFGAKPSSNLEELYGMGLLGKQAEGSTFEDFTRKANRQSNVQGLLTGVLSYLAQPKNQNFGSALPYLARAGLQGVQAAGSSIEGYEQDAMKRLKLQQQQKVLAQQAATEELKERYRNDPRVIADPILQATLEVDPAKALEIIMKPEPVSELKSFSREDDLFSINPDGTKELIRKGIAKVDSTGLYPAQAVEMADGQFAFLPTPKGLQRGLKAVGLDGKPYTGDLIPMGKPMTESQSQAFEFGKRMDASNANFEGLYDEDLNPSFSPLFLASKRNFEKMWVVGDAIGGAMNLRASAQDQMASQSMRDFINAALRDESGAAIAESEFTNAQAQYFPEVGDSKAVIRQKAQNRKIAIQVKKASSGQDADGKSLVEEYVRAIKAGEDITGAYGGTHFGKNKDKETKPKPIPKRATINGRIIVEDLSKGQWVYEDTGKPFAN